MILPPPVKFWSKPKRGKIIEGKIIEGKIIEGKIIEGKIIEGKIMSSFARRSGNVIFVFHKSLGISPRVPLQSISRKFLNEHP